MFTRSLDAARKLVEEEKSLPNHLRWPVLKRGHVDHLTANPLVAVAKMTKQGLDTMTAWELKEKIPWITQGTHAKCSAAADYPLPEL